MDTRRPTSRALKLFAQIALFAGFVAGCGSPSLVAVELDPPSAELHAGSTETITLAATGIYADGTRKAITSGLAWTSSAETAATVDAMGVVHAGPNAGTARITAKSGSIVSAPAVISVLPSAAVTRIEVSPATATMPTGTRLDLAATATYADGRTSDVTRSATWTSSDASIASVDAHGVTMALAPGAATITATLGGVSGTSAVTVTTAMLQAIDVEPPSANVPVGATQPFTATGRYSDGSVHALAGTVAWSSSDGTIASIDAATGIATGHAAGTATITATMGSVTGTATMTVTAAALDHVEIDPAAPAPLALGRTLPFHATGVYTDGTTIDLTANPALVWSSDMATVASISNATGTSGIATALAVGSTLIHAEFTDPAGTHAATPVTLAVTDAALDSIEVSPPAATLPRAFEMPFRATGHYSNGTVADVTSSATWSSSADPIATVSNAAGHEGVATGVAPGNATITATIGALAGTATLTVSDVTLASISVLPPAADVPLGTTRQFAATGTFSDGSTMDLTTRATWSIAPADLGRGVTISSSTGRQGLATVSPSATPSATPVSIYATYGSVSGIAQLTIVTPRTLIGIVVTVDQPVIPVGYGAQARARGIVSDGVHPVDTVDITNLVTWSPVVGGILTVSNAAGSKGAVTGIASGTDQVDACLSGVCASDPGGTSSTATVRVTSCPFLGVDVVPIGSPSLQIPRGTARPFAAYARWAVLHGGGACSDLASARYDVTRLATWSSSNAGVLTVSNAVGSQGVVTAAATPTSTTADVNALFASLIGSATLTVIDACVDSIVVAPPSASIPAGVRTRFTANAHFTDGTTLDYTDLATWSDESAGYVGIVGRGVVQSFRSGGSETITATALATGSCVAHQGTAMVTVNGARLTSIAITPPSPSIPIGTTTDLTATGTYDDASTFDLTVLAGWTSSNNAVATVDAGHVRGVSDGTAVIMATVGTVSGTASASVGGRTITSVAVQADPAFECATFAGAYPVGVAFPLHVIASYSDGSAPEDVTAMATWSSGAGTIVMVDASGIASTLAAGGSDVRADVGTVHGILHVDVAATTLRSVVVDPATFVMPLSSHRQFRAFGYYDATGFPPARCDITSLATWTALPSASLSIVAGGLASSTSTPSLSATVTATRGTITGTARGVVRGACFERIDVRPTSASTPLGVSQQFFAQAVLSDGSAQDVTRDATWMTDNPTVATVSRGLATPRSPGSANLTASYDAGSASCGAPGTLSGAATLTVSPASLTTVSVDCHDVDRWSSTSFGIPAGVQIDCHATGRYSDGSVVDVTDGAAWTSSSPSIAAVSDDAGSKGTVLGRAAGTTSVDANVGGVHGTFSLVVVGATLSRVVVLPSMASLPVGFQQQYRATGLYTLGSVTNNYDITDLATWASGDGTHASVSNAPGTRGLATALLVSSGAVSISATYQSVSGSASLVVNDATISFIQVLAPNDSLAVGQGQQYRAIGIYFGSSGGFIGDVTDAVAWGTTNPSVATADAGGAVTATGLGTVAITAELGAASGSDTLTVVSACIDAMSVVASSSSAPADVPIRFQATAHYTDGASRDVTGSARFFTSDSTRIPRPSEDGWSFTRASASAGAVDITAIAASGLCAGTGVGRATIQVTAATLSSIAVHAGDGPTVPVGMTTPFVAEGRYSDGTTYDITRTIDAWTTGSVSVAVVAPAGAKPGLVTGVGMGSTPVVATQGSVSGSGTVTVTGAVLTTLTPQGLDTRGACRDAVDSRSWTRTGFAHPAGGFHTWVRALGTFSDGTTHDLTDQVVWSTGSGGTASVSNGDGQHGEVTTGAAGTVTLTATAPDGTTGTVDLLVASGTLDRLDLNRGGADPIFLALGNQLQLATQGHFGADWYCVTSDTTFGQTGDVVGVDMADGVRGRVHAIAMGSGTVTGTIGLVLDSIVVTVGMPALSSLAVLPSPLSLRVGETAQMRAIGTYSDGTTNDVTYNVGASWGSSNEGVAAMTVAPKGLLRGVSAGSARIDVCMAAICASGSGADASITVTP